MTFAKHISKHHNHPYFIATKYFWNNVPVEFIGSWFRYYSLVTIYRKRNLHELIFRLSICLRFFISKISTFYRTGCFFFKICKMYTYQYFWLEITNNFFHELVLHILCELLCNDILLMNKTYIPSMFSVLLQLKDLISENMKISK